jgi:hypothetical protein
VIFLAAGLTAPLVRADDDDSLIRFEGGIGVDPVSGIANGTPVLNVVRGVNPGGVPWVIARLRADVETDGHITVRGRGLLLAGGNGIGTSAGLKVVATLFCGTPGTAFRSAPAGVQLDTHGDFHIDDFLTPTPPTPCPAPVLLITTTGTPRWFAVGIPKTDQDEDRDR